MPSILLLESINSYTKEWFSEHGWNVRERQGALSEEEILEEYRQQPFQYLGIRSKTKLPPTVLDQLTELLAIGCFCIGTDQVDLDKAARTGKVVFNSPFTSSRSVAELVIGYTISLSRRLFEHNSSIHAGHWSKSSKNSHEIKDRVLGIVGYGHIGTQLSVLAEALGMRVIFYDIIPQMPLGNATPCATLEELLTTADIVTLHVPRTDDTINLIDAKEINAMKTGSILINASRGSVVNLKAVYDALQAGKLFGAAIDVYPLEPRKVGPFETILQGVPNVILTPHIGGATEEAQLRIATDVTKKLWDYHLYGSTQGSVNIPELKHTPEKPRILHIHHNQPNIIANVSRILGEHNYNITSEILATTETIGCANISTDKILTVDVIEELQKIQGTIIMRVF